MTATARADGALPGGADTACARFLGDPVAFRRLLMRGAGCLVITLGIYRFWLLTDIRQFLWSNTEIGGDVLEYLGTARELVIGFVLAVALLVPIYGAFWAATLTLALLPRLFGVLGLVLLALFGQFAVFRARRYRLSRTLFRGLRFHQTGSAWRYAASAVGWWAIVLVTLGLAYPWAQASLERYKMRHTFYGDLSGGFEGSGTRLFLRGVPMWVFTVGPLILGLTVMIRAVDFSVLAEVQTLDGEDVLAQIETANPQFAAAMLYGGLALGFSAVAAAALYPALQALLLRWWLSGLRFGEIAVTSRLRTKSIYAIYMRCVGQALMLSMVVMAAGVAIAAFMRLLSVALAVPGLTEGLSTVAVVGFYVVTALTYFMVYQQTVKLGLWQLGVQSLDLAGLGALERVKAQAVASSALGEGLVDALHVGGY
jgi:uncharacterized membrane protein YjgN (DUF898 family)